MTETMISLRQEYDAKQDKKRHEALLYLVAKMTQAANASIEAAAMLAEAINAPYQTQYNLERLSATVIFTTPGFGKIAVPVKDNE